LTLTIKMDLIIGIASVLIVFFSSSLIEKRLKSIEKQNNRLIEITGRRFKK